MAAQGRHQWALQCKGDPIQTWSVLHEEIPKTKFWGEISLKPEKIILIIMEVISFWRRWCQSFYYCSVVTIIFFVSVQNLFTVMKKKIVIEKQLPQYHSIFSNSLFTTENIPQAERHNAKCEYLFSMCYFFRMQSLHCHWNLRKKNAQAH